ncbi:deoxyribose-phosphate aldolase [Rhodospirillum sp. A1_3_36]|uniref:deoxyribose-phosphate aldolase n=1 Tax=Rhodospirillum sp. A1_3_36 TaxID=3391666 RepID=UPI0039A461C8
MTDPTSVSNAKDLASYIDHTLLKPDACPEAVEALCAEAVDHGFKAVCVNPLFIPLVTRCLAGSPVVPCAVICFPFGADPSVIKAAEASWVVEQGAGEVDMVIPIGLLKAGEDALVREDIALVKAACGSAVLKVILETALLTQEEKVRACLLSKEAGADFVKTSTGFAGGGATVEDIALMRETVGPDMGVKASGGVRTTEDARRMIAAGATRIGASASIAIIGAA